MKGVSKGVWDPQTWVPRKDGLSELKRHLQTSDEVCAAPEGSMGCQNVLCLAAAACEGLG